MWGALYLLLELLKCTLSKAESLQSHNCHKDYCRYELFYWQTGFIIELLTHLKVYNVEYISKILMSNNQKIYKKRVTSVELYYIESVLLEANYLCTLRDFPHPVQLYIIYVNCLHQHRLVQSTFQMQIWANCFQFCPLELQETILECWIIKMIELYKTTRILQLSLAYQLELKLTQWTLYVETSRDCCSQLFSQSFNPIQVQGNVAILNCTFRSESIWQLHFSSGKQGNYNKFGACNIGILQ